MNDFSVVNWDYKDTHFLDKGNFAYNNRSVK